jgi:hypothetical protein
VFDGAFDYLIGNSQYWTIAELEYIFFILGFLVIVWLSASSF